jgi:hypothetical protein
LKLALSTESLLAQKLLTELHAKIKIQVRKNGIAQRISTEHKRGKTVHKKFLNQIAPESIAGTFTKLLLR